MHDMEMLKDMLTEELEKFAKKGELTAGSLDAIHKLTDTVKNICKIEALTEEAEGGASSYHYQSYRRGGEGGSSYRRQTRDSMGRYSSDGGSYARDGRGGGRSGTYSRAEAKADIMDRIEELMQDANEQERSILQRAMKSMENA